MDEGRSSMRKNKSLHEDWMLKIFNIVWGHSMRVGHVNRISWLGTQINHGMNLTFNTFSFTYSLSYNTSLNIKLHNRMIYARKSYIFKFLMVIICIGKLYFVCFWNGKRYSRNLLRANSAPIGVEFNLSPLPHMGIKLCASTHLC